MPSARTSGSAPLDEFPTAASGSSVRSASYTPLPKPQGTTHTDGEPTHPQQRYSTAVRARCIRLGGADRERSVLDPRPDDDGPTVRWGAMMRRARQSDDSRRTVVSGRGIAIGVVLAPLFAGDVIVGPVAALVPGSPRLDRGRTSHRCPPEAVPTVPRPWRPRTPGAARPGNRDSVARGTSRAHPTGNQPIYDQRRRGLTIETTLVAY